MLIPDRRTGLAMPALGLFFLGWMKLRPVEIPTPAATDGAGPEK